MALLYRPSKGISVDKQANDNVVHLDRFREADGPTDQAFDARPQRQMLALDFLRVAFAGAVDFRVQMPCVRTPMVRIEACEPEGLQ